MFFGFPCANNIKSTCKTTITLLLLYMYCKVVQAKLLLLYRQIMIDILNTLLMKHSSHKNIIYNLIKPLIQTISTKYVYRDDEQTDGIGKCPSLCGHYYWLFFLSHFLSVSALGLASSHGLYEHT